MIYYKNKIKNGFTLIELLVVIFILSLLFVLLIPNFTGARQRAEDARIKADMQTLRTALRTYYNDNGAYPTPSGFNLNPTFYSNYLPNQQIGATLTYILLDSDRFQLKTTLSTGNPADLDKSQTSCGVLTPTPMVFMVCAN